MNCGFPGVMGMEYDRATGYLWATCDDGCNNTTGILEIDVTVGSVYAVVKDWDVYVDVPTRFAFVKSKGRSFAAPLVGPGAIAGGCGPSWKPGPLDRP